MKSFICGGSAAPSREGRSRKLKMAPWAYAGAVPVKGVGAAPDKDGLPRMIVLAKSGGGGGLSERQRH